MLTLTFSSIPNNSAYVRDKLHIAPINWSKKKRV